MAAYVFLSGYASYGATQIYLTNLSFNEQTDAQDVTDLSTVLGEREFESTFRSGKFTSEGWLDTYVNPPSRGTELALVLDFEGFQVTGNGIITAMNVDAVFDTAMRLTFSGIFTGAINFSILGT
jgi:hypothetical protein